MKYLVGLLLGGPQIVELKLKGNESRRIRRFENNQD